jgi:outer membrane protein TolC
MLLLGLLVLLPALPASAEPAPGAPEVLTLPAALALALKDSPRLEAARQGIAAAGAARRGARAEGSPDVSFSAVKKVQGPEVSLGLPPALAPPGGTVLTPSQELDLQLQAALPLYTGGRVSADRSAAKHLQQAARLRLEAERQRLVYDVTGSYLDVLEAKQQADLAGAMRGLTASRLQVARVRLKAGATLPLEVSQAEADLAGAVQSEIEAGARVEQAGATLNSLLGRPAGTPVVLAPLPEAEPPTPLVAGAPHASTPEELRAAGLSRPDLQALREDAMQAGAQVSAARATKRPQIGLSALALDRIPKTLLGGFTWSLAASLAQSLFDGGKARARIDAAKAEAGRRSAVVKESERQAEAVVERARVALDAAEKRLAAADRRVSAAAEAVTVAQRRQSAGAAIPTEVDEARVSLVRAQTDAVTARFEAARARVQLAYAAGLADPKSVANLAVVAPPSR